MKRTHVSAHVLPLWREGESDRSDYSGERVRVFVFDQKLVFRFSTACELAEPPEKKQKKNSPLIMVNFSR